MFRTHPFGDLNMSKNNEKRIRFAPVPLAILDEYCELHGMTPSAAISPLITAHLRHPSRTSRHLFQMNNNIHSQGSTDSPQIAAKEKPKPRKKKMQTLREQPLVLCSLAQNANPEPPNIMVIRE